MSDTYRKISVIPEQFGSRDFAAATSIVNVKLPAIPPGAVEIEYIHSIWFIMATVRWV